MAEDAISEEKEAICGLGLVDVLMLTAGQRFEQARAQRFVRERGFEQLEMARERFEAEQQRVQQKQAWDMSQALMRQLDNPDFVWRTSQEDLAGLWDRDRGLRALYGGGEHTYLRREDVLGKGVRDLDEEVTLGKLTPLQGVAMFDIRWGDAGHAMLLDGKLKADAAEDEAQAIAVAEGDGPKPGAAGTPPPPLPKTRGSSREWLLKHFEGLAPPQDIDRAKVLDTIQEVQVPIILSYSDPAERAAAAARFAQTLRDQGLNITDEGLLRLAESGPAAEPVTPAAIETVAGMEIPDEAIPEVAALLGPAWDEDAVKAVMTVRTQGQIEAAEKAEGREAGIKLALASKDATSRRAGELMQMHSDMSVATAYTVARGEETEARLRKEAGTAGLKMTEGRRRFLSARLDAYWEAIRFPDKPINQLWDAAAASAGVEGAVAGDSEMMQVLAAIYGGMQGMGRTTWSTATPEQKDFLAAPARDAYDELLREGLLPERYRDPKYRPGASERPTTAE